MMKARKKTTRLDGPTHTHIHTVTHSHPHARSIDHSWSLSHSVLSLCVPSSFFLLKMEIISQPPLMIWYWALLNTASYPTFLSTLYIITGHSLSSSPSPCEAWRCISWHVDFGSTNPFSRLVASVYALLLPSWPAQIIVLPLSISRASFDPIVVLESLPPLTRRKIPLRYWSFLST